jgi:radical SAM superfamily enzyme YgiQ (UPF0313 family)
MANPFLYTLMTTARIPGDSLPAWDVVPLRVLIVRLSPWQDVRQSSPHLLLHHEVLRGVPGALVDFSFFPSQHQREAWVDEEQPWMRGVRSGRGATAFDVLLVSNSCGVELINFPLLLERSGIPLFAGDRGDEIPLILFGGSNAMAAQGIVAESGDSLADGIFFGEGEGVIAAMAAQLALHASLPKKERLERVASAVAGLWPAGKRSRKVQRQVHRVPSGDSIALDYPAFDGDQADTARLPISWGCPCFCSFCFEGYDRKPYREVSREQLLASARELKMRHGIRTLELHSFNFNSHREILPLLEDLHVLFEEVSVKSQRIDFLVSVSGMIDMELLLEKRSFTLGIEGVSARLRRYLNKTLSLREIQGCIEALVSRKARQLKLFYLLAGTETEADFRELADFAKWLKTLLRAKASGTRVIFSFGNLVRMPGTPLGFSPLLLDSDQWGRLAKQAKHAVGVHGFEFRLAADQADYLVSQAVALGGYWMVDALIWLERKGHFYDATISKGAGQDLRVWLEEHGHWDAPWMLEKRADYPFPLEFVEGGVSRDFLYAQYQSNLSEQDLGYCLGSKCFACSACESPAEKTTIMKHRVQPRSPAQVQKMAERTRVKRLLKPFYLQVRLPAEANWCSREWVRSWVLRQILAAFPDQLENLLGVQEALFSVSDNRRDWEGVAGWTVVGLKAWDRGQFVAALSLKPRPSWLGSLVDEGWTEGQWKRARLQIVLEKHLFPDALRRFSAFLHRHYCPSQVSHSEGRVLYTPGEKALKKRILFSGIGMETESDWVLDVECGPNLALREFLIEFGDHTWIRSRCEVMDLLLP